MFQNIVNSIELIGDDYIFKDGKFSKSFQGFFNNIELNAIPTYEEICDYFEEFILKKVPHALLFINDNLSIEVNINKENSQYEKLWLARKEINIYESIKTLFFPTMKEKLVKQGSMTPKYIYIPSSKIELTNRYKNGDLIKGDQYIRIITYSGTQLRNIEGIAIDLLSEEIMESLNNFEFQNPIHFCEEFLPQPDLNLENLKKLNPKRLKGFSTHEFYSYQQKIKFIKQLFNDFILYYKDIIEENFPRIRNAFPLYKSLPVKIEIKTSKGKDEYGREDVNFSYKIIQKLDNSNSEIELIENVKDDEESKVKYIKYIHTGFSSILFWWGISPFLSMSNGLFGGSHLKFIENTRKNALPFTYDYIAEELDEILEKFRSDAIFDEIKPFHPRVVYWINKIIDAEKQGGETYNIELKTIPTENEKGDGSGQDIYGHINAMENAEGGYIYIGVDESIKGIDRIVGLNGYITYKKTTLDKIKLEIQDKCRKYLKKDYPIEADEYLGKKIIQIKVRSNNGGINYFQTKQGWEIVYIRLNGKKVRMKSEELERRTIEKHRKLK